MTQISLSSVGVQYGATTVLGNVTVTIASGERWGVIGRNGSGKTSLFRLITGDQEPSSGTIARTPGLRFAVLDQHRAFGDAQTVWNGVAESFRFLMDLEQALALQAEAMATAGAEVTEAQLNRYARDLEQFEHSGGYRYTSMVDEVLEGLGFDAKEAREIPISQLSGGERGRVALARQLVLPADVLLLDEPTNHLDLETTAWLEEYLRNSRETQLIISHDRAFLQRVVDHVLHLEDNTAFAYDGSYASFVEQRAARRLTQQRAFSRQQKNIAREEDYIRRNIAGQNTRQAKGRRKRLEWLPRLSPPPDDEAAMSVRFRAGERGGDQVLAVDKASLKVGDRKLLEGFSGWIRRGDVIGLIGPNGAGKSTFLRAMLGEMQTSAGELRVGGGILTAMYRQDFANVPRDKTLYDVIADMRPMWERGQVMGHLGRVQFSGDETKRATSTLSGGELARLALAIMMLENANFLVFDEPTNHLDVESIEALEDAIEEYEGTVLLVSHDRELLRKLVTKVWELDRGQIRILDGTFEEWEADAKRRSELARRDMEAKAQRLRDDAREKRKRSSEAQAASRNNSPGSRRLAEAAEKRVSELDELVAELTASLAEPDLYETEEGRERATEIVRRLASAREQLAQAMDDWEIAMAEGEPH